MTYVSSSSHIHCPQHSVRMSLPALPHSPQRGPEPLRAGLVAVPRFFVPARAVPGFLRTVTSRPPQDRWWWPLPVRLTLGISGGAKRRPLHAVVGRRIRVRGHFICPCKAIMAASAASFLFLPQGVP